jgi:O-palmitoleoyl-L-serine hydrolase
MLSNNLTYNPDFASFNKVYIRYCDGASYSGDLTDPLVVGETTLYMRGRRIVDAVVDDLLMNHDLLQASSVLVSGCSAGGLAAYLHCDYIAGRLAPWMIPVRCAPDGGYFTDLLAISGTYVLRNEYQYVYAMQNASGGVNADCVAASSGAEWQCFMPQYTLPFIRTPVFVINSGYDSWQTSNVWFPAGPWGEQPDAEWAPCAGDLTKCTPTQLAIVQQYHRETLAALEGATDPNALSVGAWIDSCFEHCQTSYWNSGKTIAGKTLAQAGTHGPHLTNDAARFSVADPRLLFFSLPSLSCAPPS